MKKIFIFVLALFIVGCTNKSYITFSKSYKIVIKLKSMAFSDLGFLKQGNDYIEMELFDAGSLVLKLEVKKQNVCVNSHCFSKKEFNDRFLYKEYPSNLLENILNKRVIFKKTGYIKTETGFTQEIKTDKIDIKYTVSYDKIYFKDKKNHILIKLKELNE